MSRRPTSIVLLASSCIAFAAAGGACDKKSGSAPAVSASGSAVNASASSAKPAPSAALPVHATSAVARAKAREIAEKCSLPEPPAPKSPGAADAAFKKKLAAAAKCDPSHIGCEVIDDVVRDAKAAVSSDNKVPARILAACIEGLDDASPLVRKAAADCIEGVSASVPEPGAAIVALLGKLEAQRPEDVDVGNDVALHYAFALMGLEAGHAGYTCRVLRLVERLPSKASYASEVMRTLGGMGNKATEEAYDYAYERVMSNDGSSVNTAAMSLVSTYAPPSREGVRCERLQNVMKAGVEGWGEASTGLRKPTCEHPESTVATAVQQLRFIQDAPDYETIERPLLDAAFVAELPTWREVSAEQKKTFCDAAEALAQGGKTDEAKALGKKIVALCH